MRHSRAASQHREEEREESWMRKTRADHFTGAWKCMEPRERRREGEREDVIDCVATSVGRSVGRNEDRSISGHFIKLGKQPKRDGSLVDRPTA